MSTINPHNAEIPREETGSLIASNKIDGTAVYNPAGEHLGKIHNFMVDKRSGKVSYAVMSFGGFLGIGDSYFPLPWEQLAYDTSKGGYVVNISRDRLDGAPSYAASAEPDWNDPTYGRRVDEFYDRPSSII